MASDVLDKIGIKVNKNGFGALPIQRTSMQDATHILRKAYNAGIKFFDTAKSYSDSEEKIGNALCEVRHDICLATKTKAGDADEFFENLHSSLKKLRTDYIDVYQFHNPSFCPKPGDGSGLYEAMTEAKAQGKIRFISISSHKLSVAEEAVASGLYDTLQFPFSYLANEKDIAVMESCTASGMGFIAMKSLSGGLIKNSEAAYAYIAQFSNVMPIWGIQHEWELDEFIAHMKNPPEMTPAIKAVIDKDRQQLKGDFCRGCGYCMPCPAGIEINECARISLWLRRAPFKVQISTVGQAMMKKVEDCMHCDMCSAHCPYNLDVPTLLEKNYQDYLIFLDAHKE